MSEYQKPDGSCFLGQKRVLVVKCMQHGTTITSEAYGGGGTPLKILLLDGHLGKKHVTLTYGAVLLHEKAHQQRPAHTQAMLKHFNWEFDRPSYSSTLTWSNYKLNSPPICRKYKVLCTDQIKWCTP